MNLKRIALLLMGAGLLFTACNQKEDDTTPRITVSPVEISLPETEGSTTLQVVSTRDWYVSDQPSWVALSLTSGSKNTKGETITLTVDANPGKDRSGEVVFNIGLAKTAVTVNQKGAKGEVKMGSGTKEDPYSVAGVLEYTRSLGSDIQSPSSVYFYGRVSKVATSFAGSGSYGNANFYIVDPDGGTDEDFYVFQTYYLGGKQWKSGDTDIKEGDDVIICGPVVNYKGNTPETAGKGASYIYSLNGDTGKEDPGEKTTGSVTEIIATEDGTSVQIPEAIVAALSSKGFIATDGTSNIYVYLNAEPAVAIGDKVSIAAQKTTYYGLPELTSPDVNTISSGNEVPRTSLLDITSGIDSYDSSVADYITVTGTLTFDGTYYNVAVPGASRQATPSSLHSSIDPSAYVNQEVKMTGYFNTIYQSKNLVQIVVTEVVPADPNAKYCSPSTFEIKVAADAVSATFDIKANAAWALTSDNQAVTVSPASGSGDATVTVSFPANEADEAVKSEIHLVCADANVNTVITLVQASASSASEVVIDLTAQGYANAEDFSSITIDGVTLTGDAGSNKNGPKYYTTGNAVRFYGGNSFTVSAGKNITKIEITFGSGDGSNELTAAPGSFSGSTWTGSASSVTFTVGGTTGHRRVAKLVVSF